MKTLFFDIDGTIIDVPRGMKNPSRRTVYSLRRLQEKGHRVIIASGRMKSMLPESIMSIPVSGYMMCNGAIFELKDWPTAFLQIDPDLVKDVMQACEETGSIYYLENGYDIFTNGLGKYLHEYFVEGWDDETEYKDIKERTDLPTIMMMVTTPDHQIGEMMYERFKDKLNITNTFPEQTCYDYNGIGTDKGEGIRRYLERENLRKEDCYCFGDSYNDVEMLKAVGHGYAMGNSWDGLKEIAEEVIGDVLEDGIYYKLVELGLIEPLEEDRKNMEKYIIVTKHQKDFFENRPQIMDNDFDHHGKMALVDAYGSIYTDGPDKPPVLFVRHGNRSSYRFGGCARLSCNSLGVQSPEHGDDMAQKEPTGEFRLLSEDPWTYGYGTEEPFSQYRYVWDEKGLRGYWKEGDFLDLVAEPFDYCIIQRMGKLCNFAQIIQPSIVTGTYNGKPVRFLGSFDKVFMSSDEDRDVGAIMSYILVLDHGIRPDGRRESCIVFINAEGDGVGMYYLEGEEPVVSENIRMECDWFHQPYSDDGTVMYKDAVFHIGDKKIHFQGKWGAKGITAKPRYEKHGQSQIFGSWYEGDEPYVHTLETTFHEQLEAYDWRIAGIADKLGFRIID